MIKKLSDVVKKYVILSVACLFSANALAVSETDLVALLRKHIGLLKVTELTEGFMMDSLADGLVKNDYSMYCMHLEQHLEYSKKIVALNQEFVRGVEEQDPSTQERFQNDVKSVNDLKKYIKIGL